MANNRSGHVYQEQQSGDSGGQGGGAQVVQQGGGQGGQGGQQPSAADARAFLTEYVHDPEFLKSVPDEKVVPWYSRVKQKVEGFTSQFPEKWRDLVAGDNVEHKKTLERFQSPKALYESYAALRQKMSSGELKAITPFPDKGTPEEQTAWRTASGIPGKPEEYLAAFKAPEGVELTDDDKAVLGKLSASAHASNLPPSAFNATASWFLTEKQARTEARQDRDAEFRASSEDALRAEWGTDYRQNVARIGALLDTAPKGVKEQLAGARLADGTRFGDHPEVLRFFADISRQVNPAGVVLPGAGGNLAQSIEDEIGGIEKTMREDRTKYNKDEKMQARYRELLGAREKLGKKAA